MARLSAMIALNGAGFEGWIKPLPWDVKIPRDFEEQAALYALRILVACGRVGPKR